MKQITARGESHQVNQYMACFEVTSSILDLADDETDLRPEPATCYDQIMKRQSLVINPVPHSV